MLIDKIELPAEGYIPIVTADGTEVGGLMAGGAETKLGATVMTLVIHRGDLINVRNIQGGTVDSPNLDISAGGDGATPDTPPGVVVINRDNGHGFDIGRGQPAYGMAMTVRSYNANHAKDNVTVRVPLYITKGAYVPDGAGSWRRAL